jgi:hypothetical protein
MTERVTSTQRGAIGGVEWHTPSAVYAWFGPGGGLYLVFGGTLARIEHPAASGDYDTSDAARRALDAFLAAVSAQEQQEGRAGE